jgi:hypothetical protein
MAAPKTGGMLFRGTFRGEPKPVCRITLLFKRRLIGMADEAESGLSPGAACTSLAVPERTRRTHGTSFTSTGIATRLPSEHGSVHAL